MSLRKLALRQNETYSLSLSHAQLARYEVGQLLPPLQYAQHLDRLYEAEGWIEMNLRSLWRPRWDPWGQEHGSVSRFHSNGWPAKYGGVVWVKLKPHAQTLDSPHGITLTWGPWVCEVHVEIQSQGVVLLTGKAIDLDGVSNTCNLTCDKPVFALFGAGGALDGDVVIDIRDQWTWGHG